MLQERLVRPELSALQYIRLVMYVYTDMRVCMQDATLPPKPGMAHIGTDVGESLRRGDPESTPAARAPRVSCPAAPVHTDADWAPAAPAAAARRRSGSRSSGGELPRHPFRDPRGAGASPLGPHGQRHHSPPPDSSAALAELAQAVQKKHRAFAEALSARESQLGIVRTFWEKGDVRAVVAAVARAGDASLAIDVFRFLRKNDRPQQFRLAMCVPTAQAVDMCLRARSDTAAMVGLSFLELVLKGFAADIRTGCAFVEKDRGPVDIKGEERRQHCREARDAFVEILPGIRKFAGGEDGPPRALQECAGSVAHRIERMAG